MEPIIGILAGLTIGWLMLTNWEVEREVRRQREELTAARLTIARMRRQLELSTTLLESERRRPFGSTYVEPYSIFFRN